MNYINPSIGDLNALGLKNAQNYAGADPYPNACFDDFFDPAILQTVLQEFPDMSRKTDSHFNDLNQNKLASRGEGRFGPVTREFMRYLNSQPFLEFLSVLTGIKDLIPDPFFVGGGCHQIRPGGMLKLHADFNKHPNNRLDRRLNVLIYLNQGWEESYGGHFQLWDKDMTRCARKVLPVFNRMALFSTTSVSYHGHPDPLTCPPDRSRKSLALYYYTNGRPTSEIHAGKVSHSTIFRLRPQDHSSAGARFKDAARQWIPPIIMKMLVR